MKKSIGPWNSFVLSLPGSTQTSPQCRHQRVWLIRSSSCLSHRSSSRRHGFRKQLSKAPRTATDLPHLSCHFPFKLTWRWRLKERTLSSPLAPPNKHCFRPSPKQTPQNPLAQRSLLGCLCDRTGPDRTGPDRTDSKVIEKTRPDGLFAAFGAASDRGRSGAGAERRTRERGGKPEPPCERSGFFSKRRGCQQAGGQVDIYM